MSSWHRGHTVALVVVAVFVASLGALIAPGWWDQTKWCRTSLLYGVERCRPTTCGFVRTLTPSVLDVIPCQFWNLMPLTIVALWAAGWLVADRLRRARSDD